MNDSLLRATTIRIDTGNVRILVTALAVLAIALLPACNTVPRSGTLPTPGFVQSQTRNAAGTWSTASLQLSPAPAVLPARGRAVRVAFTAPVGSTFTVWLRTPDGTATPVPEKQGTPPPPEAAYFEIVSVDVSLSPPVYLMYVRAPISLTDPTTYAIEIVNRSLRTDVTDSAPLVVALGKRPVYTVTVRVVGDGHVTSNPPGIQCGTSPLGRSLTDCRYEFGPGLVRLNPNSNDLDTTRFDEWSGNCAPGVQVCEFTLDGTAPVSATATFEARTSTTPVSSCPTAPLRPGRRWVDKPNCGGVLFASLQCDAQGYFCCGASGGVATARCSGQNETAVTCANDNMGITPGNGLLIQPGGCYEVDD